MSPTRITTLVGLGGGGWGGVGVNIYFFLKNLF